jgi:cytochrome c551
MRSICGFVIVLTVLLLCACGQETDDSDLRSSITKVEEGGAAALYKKRCVSCHATDLSGRVGPSLQKVGSRLTEEQMITIIQEGIKGMPSYKNRLDQQEIEALAQWLVKMR